MEKLGKPGDTRENRGGHLFHVRLDNVEVTYVLYLWRKGKDQSIEFLDLGCVSGGVKIVYET